MDLLGALWLVLGVLTGIVLMLVAIWYVTRRP